MMTSRQSVPWPDNGCERRAAARALVEWPRSFGKAPKESEHLRSLAHGCQGMAKELADTEMAQLFDAMAADYRRRARRLAIVGR